MAHENKAKWERYILQEVIQMTKEELIKLGLTEEQAEAVTKDYGENYVSKSQFNAKNDEAKTAKAAKEASERLLAEAQGKLEKINSTGIKDDAGIIAMQERIKTLEDSVEAERKVREDADAQRIQSEIAAAVVDSLTKRNAMDPKEFSKLIVSKIKANEDGTYGYVKSDGTSGTVDDCVDEWLKGKDYAIKDSQKRGSGSGNGGAGNGGEGNKPAGLKGAVAAAIEAQQCE